jgi:hypothetical protein
MIEDGEKRIASRMDLDLCSGNRKERVLQHGMVSKRKEPKLE